MKKIITLLVAVFSMALVGCSATESEVKDVPVAEIKTAIHNETLLPIQPVEDVDAKEFYVFENVKDNIEEGFVLKAGIIVNLQDVFVVKANDVEKVKQAIEEYKTNDRGFMMFADGYGGEDNITSAANSILESVGDYVYFIATPNAKDIEAKILELLK